MANKSGHNQIASAIYESLKDKKGHELAQAMKNVVKFLAHKGLLGSSKDILSNLQRIIYQENGVLEAKVSTAKPLHERAKHRLVHYLKNRYSVKDIALEEKIDPRFLGGVRVEANSEVIDNTVKNKIKKLEEYLVHQ